MEEEENVNIPQREEALARFRESLSLPLSERYFEEDELIDFFDYAGDLQDDYLRLEVLICAARFYPDSEELRMRKAIYHAQFSEESRMKCVEDNSNQEGMIWDIMRASTIGAESEAAKIQLLNDISDSYTEYSDEETIQLVQLASSFGQLQWLKDNLDKLREKSYPQALLYEVAVVADMQSDTRFAISLLEELTDSDPFNAGFWSFLAKEYAATDDGEKAKNAIEYALAIEPDDPMSLFIKAKIQYATDADKEEVIQTLRRVFELSPTVDVVKMMAFVLNDTGNPNAAREFLECYLDTHPDQAAFIVPDLLSYKPANADKLLDLLYGSNEDNSPAIWMAWANALAVSGEMDTAILVIQCYERNSNETLPTLLLAEYFFSKGQYTEALNAINKYLGRDDTTGADFCSLALMQVMSLVKTGDFDSAMALCKMFNKKLSSFTVLNISKRIEILGIKLAIAKISHRIKLTRDPEDWAYYDPLDPDSN